MRHALILLACSLACRAARNTGHDAPAPVDTGHADALPPIGVEIGTAHPIRLLHSATNGRWLVACQARRDTDDKPGIDARFDDHGMVHGDAMTPYLIRSVGAGVAIDGFVAASRNDRWAVLVRADQLVLFDEVNGTEQVLSGADARGEASGGRTVAAFDRRSEQLVYARRSEGDGRVAIRTLATGEEHDQVIGGQTIWQVTTDRDDRWIELSYIRIGFESRNRASWPHLESSAQPGLQCRGFDLNFMRLTTADISYRYLRTDTGELVRERPANPFADNVYASFDDHTVEYALGTGFRVTDTRTGQTTLLPGLHGDISENAGRFVAIGNAVVDIAAAHVIGKVARSPLAVDASGRALVPAIERSNERPAVGPLRWTAPVARKTP